MFALLLAAVLFVKVLSDYRGSQIRKIRKQLFCRLVFAILSVCPSSIEIYPVLCFTFAARLLGGEELIEVWKTCRWMAVVWLCALQIFVLK